MTRYRTIVADPPWQYDRFVRSYTPSTGRTRSLPLPYSMMSVGEIAALPVRELVQRDARLFLWTTNRYLRDAFDVAEAWGFTYKQTLVWRKTGRLMPVGGSVAPNHAEFLLVATVGSPERLVMGGSSVIDAPKGEHSVKPEVFLDFVETVSPGPYLEMFSRRARLGWDTWGDEALHGTEAMSG